MWNIYANTSSLKYSLSLTSGQTSSENSQRVNMRSVVGLLPLSELLIPHCSAEVAVTVCKETDRTVSQ